MTGYWKTWLPIKKGVKKEVSFDSREEQPSQNVALEALLISYLEENFKFKINTGMKLNSRVSRARKLLRSPPVCV